MPVYLAVAVGGALGALARYGLDRALEARSLSLFPWSTFAVNVSGCLAVGFVVAALVDRHATPAWLRLGLVMGVLGGYTTFSTFGQETLDLVLGEKVGVAALYSLGSFAAGILAVFAGTLAGRGI